MMSYYELSFYCVFETKFILIQFIQIFINFFLFPSH